MTLTRDRAGLPGNQIGVRSLRATGRSPSLGSTPLTPTWRAVEGDVHEPTEAGELIVDEPHLI
jgi:hypothetical protein